MEIQELPRSPDLESLPDKREQEIVFTDSLGKTRTYSFSDIDEEGTAKRLNAFSTKKLEKMGKVLALIFDAHNIESSKKVTELDAIGLHYEGGTSAHKGKTSRPLSLDEEVKEVSALWKEFTEIWNNPEEPELEELASLVSSRSEPVRSELEEFTDRTHKVHPPLPKSSVLRSPHFQPLPPPLSNIQKMKQLKKECLSTPDQSHIWEEMSLGENKNSSRIY